MKPFRLILALALATACAPITPEPNSGPVPGTPGPETTRPVEPPPSVQPPAPVQPQTPAQPGEPISVVPERWWMLDAVADGVYGASVDRAYREILSQRQPRRTVVVAIIDSGVDVEHEDLRGVLWSNEGERRSGRDDDGNGYADDVHGWNFIGSADGRHVEKDTYEVTRLYAACEARFGNRAPAAAQRMEQVNEEQCTRITVDFNAKLAENQQMLMQIRQMNSTVESVVSLLRQQVGTDSLTVEAVRALTPLRNDVRQARQIFLQLADNDITPKMVADELQRLEELTEYGLNPEFDPRDVVGDNYLDPTERVYGNADVIGPDASHGTGVAGIVAAQRDNNLGVDGIASAVRIMTIRAVPDGDERDKDIANAIRYAVDNGAHIINMSFGKAYSPEKAVVDAAVRHAEQAGVLLVHAAGNDAKDLATENNFPNRHYADGGVAANWIEVGASNWQGRERLAADFSNYGREQVDVFAPGASIRSTAPGNDYSAASGTSFAAPVVSGIAALLMSYYPELSVADVRRVILESATRYTDQLVARPGAPGGQVRFGELSVTGGIVNAYEAVRMAEQLAASRN